MVDDGDELVMDAIPGGAVVSFVHELEEPEGPGIAAVGFEDGEIGVAVIIDEKGEGPFTSGLVIVSLEWRSVLRGCSGEGFRFAVPGLKCLWRSGRRRCRSRSQSETPSAEGREVELMKGIESAKAKGTTLQKWLELRWKRAE
ncbi:hypothetical protein AXF42_Ash018902 [Apostasia shenzhenica]|uniref:Uncharacterized protein n=1 Tax=Apostasia shenzhenica TaxID=1088818 RepID=A0A2I0B532_9ASPA|nr:hypothetical protein AXF42_Ash018902 [Apostasia shenzhenica]